MIPFSIANLLNGGNVEIYGNGLNIRHWLHVDDTCEGIYTIFKKGDYGEVYNIGSDQYSSNIDLMKSLIEIMSIEEENIICSRQAWPRFQICNKYRKIKRLRLETKKDIKQDLNETVNWYINNQDWWSKSYKDIVEKRKRD